MVMNIVDYLFSGARSSSLNRERASSLGSYFLPTTNQVGRSSDLSPPGSLVVDCPSDCLVVICSILWVRLEKRLKKLPKILLRLVT